MNSKAALFLATIIVFVSAISFYIGGSMRGRNLDQQSVTAPIIKIEHSTPPQKFDDEATKRRKDTVSNTSEVNAKQIAAIESEFGRKKQEIENYYADKFRQLQQNVETTLKEYDADDRAAYASFTEQLKHTVSTTSGSASLTGDVSSSGYLSAHGTYDETTETEVVGNPSFDYSHHIQKTNKAIDNLMDEYELDFQHFQRRRACALADLDKEKALALAAVHSQVANQSVSPTSTIAQGVVTGIIYSEESPLAVIDGKVLHEGQNIRGVKIGKINQDRVEFETDGVRWSQKVNEQPSSFWP